MFRNISGILVTFLAAFCWALASIFYRKASTKLPSVFTVNVLRVPLALVFLYIVVSLRGGFGLILEVFCDYDSLLILFLATFIMNVLGDSMYLLAIRNIGVSIGYPLSYMYPVFVSILAIIILGEQQDPSIFAGTFMAILGIWLISQRNKDYASVTDMKRFVVGVLAGVGAAVCFALGIILFRIAVLGLEPILVATVKLILLPALIFPIVFKEFVGTRKNLDMKALLIAMVGGVFGLGVGDWLFYVGLDEIGASLAATITTSSPMMSLLLAIILLKERMNAKQAFGVLLIILGVLLSIS